MELDCKAPRPKKGVPRYDSVFERCGKLILIAHSDEEQKMLARLAVRLCGNIRGGVAEILETKGRA